MTLIHSLYSSLSGLRTAQEQLQVVSNNIANVNTPGYTRKIAKPETVVIDGKAAGVRLTGIERNVSEALYRQLRAHIAMLSGQRIENDFLDRTQGLFGTLADNSSLAHSVADLSSALESFSTSPDSSIDRISVVTAARGLADRLDFVTDSLQQMRVDADRRISDTVATVNDLITRIHELNQQIARGVSSGNPTPDLEDQRDSLLDSLSEEIGIQYFQRTTGEVVITTSSGRLLLDSVPVSLSYTPATQLSAAVTLGNGISGVLYGPAGLDITQELTSGRLGGLLMVRDQTLVDLQAEVDRLAEVLRDELNAAHNQGTSFPPPASLTGTRRVAATDAPAMSGSFRVTVVDSDGIVVETLDIDLTALAPPNIGSLVTQIDGMANASASINAAGQVAITATGANRITLNELDSAVSSGNAGYGMAQFLGLNDLYDAGLDYDRYTSDRAASATAALGLAGTLSFSIAGATTNVAYGAGDSLTDIATAINGAVGGANISATVAREGAGFRLQIADADGDNFFLSDSGALTGQLNLRAGAAGIAGQLAVRSTLLQNPSLLAHAESSAAVGLAVGDIAVSAADGSIARALAAALTRDLSFAAAGGISARVESLVDYAAQILANNAAEAGVASDTVAAGESFRIMLENQAAEISDVDLDEELADIIILQNAYAASARVTSTVTQMLDVLLELVAP